MLEGLVAWVLNNYLGKYVENLNTDQLSVALLSGKVELENLPLKKDALRHLGLPVEVKAGFIGKVQLQVPVRQIRSAPWLIAIEKLYLVAAPVNLDEWDSGVEASIAHERKIALLDALEAEWRARHEAADAGYYATSYSSWLSYGTGLLANIVENLQLKLNDVHIRFEDALTCGGRAFACGLTAEALAAESCDCEWRRGFTLLPDPDGCSFKLLELQQLAVYWDPMPVPAGMLATCTIGELTERMSQTWKAPHRYLLEPASATARVRRERTAQPLRSRTRPRLTAHLTLNNVALNLNSRQYSEAVNCALGLEQIARLREFRALRPALPVRGHARHWWLYALRCHTHNYHWTEPKPTWESCLEAARRTREYVESCLFVISNPAATLPAPAQRRKDSFEWDTPLHILKPLREVAMRKVPKMTPVSTPDKPASQAASGRSMLVHWFPQWWGWYGQQEPAAPPDAPPAPDAPPPDLEEEILDVLADSLENNTLLKRDTVFGKFEFELSKGCLNLSTESDEDESKSPSGAADSGVELQFWGVSARVESRPRGASHALCVQLGAVCLRDRITPATLFPVLVAPQGMVREGLSAMNPSAAAMAWCRAQAAAAAAAPPQREPLFQLTYEKKPFGVNADYKLWVKSQSLEVVWSAVAVRWALNFVRGTDLSGGGSAGGGAAGAWGGAWARPRGAYATVRDTTKQRLITHIEHMMQHPGDRRSWQVELDISAPQIFFVEDLCDREASVLVVDFGRLRLGNAAAELGEAGAGAGAGAEGSEEEELFMTPCSTPPASLLSPADPPLHTPQHAPLDAANLHTRLYDRYKIELSELQILVGRARDNWKYAHTKTTSSLHLLDRFSISLQAERRVVATSDPQYPAATLCGSLPALVVHLSEHKLRAVRTVIASSALLTGNTQAAWGGPAAAAGGAAARAADEEASESSDTERSEHSAYQHVTLLMLQFAIDQMSLEVQSRGRSIAEVQVCGVRAAASARASDVSVSLSVHSLLLVDALQTYGPDFELLVASHKHVGMDTASGSIRDSEPTSPTSPTSPASPPAGARPPPAAPPHALRQALYSLHYADTQSHFAPELDRTSPAPSWTTGISWSSTVPPYSASTGFNWSPAWGNAGWGNTTSGWSHVGAGWGAPGFVDSEALIAVELCFVKGEGDSEDLKIANILFNNLDIIANQETIVELIGFTQRVLGSGKSPPKKVPSDVALDARVASPQAPVLEEEFKKETRTEITFDFHRLGVLLLRAGVQDGTVVAKKIATATVSEAKIQATIGGPLVSVGGSLGGVQVVSLCSGAGAHCRVLSAGRAPPAPHPAHPAPQPAPPSHPAHPAPHHDDEKALLFTIERTVHTPDDGGAPVVEVSVSVRVASVWYTHAGALVRELRSCVSQFQQYLANLARSIRAAAADMALGLVHPRGDTLYANPKLSQSMEGVSPRRRTTSMGCSLDDPPELAPQNIILSVVVELESPVVVAPRAAHSAQVLVAHLGRMSISNRPGPPTLHDYRVRVRDISLHTLDVGEKLRCIAAVGGEAMEALYDVSRGKPVLHNTALQLAVCAAAAPDTGEHTCDVSGKIVGGLHVSARREQYEQLLETLRWMASADAEPPAATAAPAHPHTEASALVEPAVPTLRLDPTLRAAVLAVPPPHAAASATPATSWTPLTVVFELPTFTLELRADLGGGERSLVELAFREFTVRYQRLHQHETSLQVSLHSVTMEDLTKEPDSKHRLLMMSHTPQVPAKAVFVSKSCPDFVTQYPSAAPPPPPPPRPPPPAPRDLHHARSGWHSLPSKLNVLDREMKRNNKRDSKCGPTPPCSPEAGAGAEAGAEGAGADDANEELSADDNLVWVSVHTRHPDHPHFEDKYNKVSRLTKVDFNCLNLVVNVDSWVTVLDFFGVAGEDLPDSGSGDGPQPQQTASSENVLDSGVTQTETWIRSLSVVVVAGRGEVCRALVSRVRVVAAGSAALGRRRVAGRLGALLLADLSPRAPLWRDRFRTHADNALTFEYRRLSSAEAAEMGHETSLNIEMGPVTYVHTKRFVQELQAFARDFSLLRRVIHQARLKVSVSAAAAAGAECARASRMLLRVRCVRPVIVLPVSGRARAALRADLQELHLDNCFKLAGDPDSVSTRTDPNSAVRETLDVRRVRLEGLSLWCARGGRGGGRGARGLRVARAGPPLLSAPACLVLTIEQNLSHTHNVPDMTIQGTLTTLQCALEPAQYRLVRGVLAHNLGEDTADLAPHAPPAPHTAQSEEVWKTSSLKLDLHDVTVKLEPAHGAASLACINFIKSRLLVETCSDLSQDIDLVSQEILVSDTRYASEPANRRGNVFTRIVQPMPDHPHSVQAELHARKRRDSSAYTIMVNNMRLMAILDWWEAAHQFIMQPPPPDADPDQPPLEESLNSRLGLPIQAAAPEEPAQMEFKLNITDSQLVLVEDASIWDTNAVILKSTTVVQYRSDDVRRPVSCSLSELEVFSCVLGLEEETALAIVDPASLHVALHADHTLKIDMGTLNLRLSYHDMRMFAAMLQSLPVQARAALSGKSESSESASSAPANSEHMRGAAPRLFTPKWARPPPPPAPPPPAARSLFPLKAVQVNADCITLCVIDDCLDSDVPLLEVSLSELQVEQDLRKVEEAFEDPLLVSTPAGAPGAAAGAVAVAGSVSPAGGGGGRRAGAGGGRLAAVLSTDYYNRTLSGWEPFIEPWRFETSWEYTLTSALSWGRVQVECASRDVLNTNVTSSLIELLQLVRANWTADYYAPQASNSLEQSPKSTPAGHRRRSPFVPYALRNHTGHRLWFTTLLTTSDVVYEGSTSEGAWGAPDDSWVMVRAGETEPFSFGLRGRARGGGGAGGAGLHPTASAPAPLQRLVLRLDGWAPPDPVAVDRVGVYFRHLTHTKTGAEARIVFEVSLEGSARKLVTVRSALQLVNKLPHPVEVRVDHAPSNERSRGSVQCAAAVRAACGALQRAHALRGPAGLGAARAQLQPSAAHPLRPILVDCAQWSGGGSRSATVGAGAAWAAPLGAGTGALWARPLVRNALPGAPAALDWRVAPALLHAECRAPPDTSYRFCCVVVRERFPAERGRGAPVPGHTLTLVPALRLENLLPLELQYRAAAPDDSSPRAAGTVPPADTTPFHEVNVEEGVEMSVKLEGFGWSSPLSVGGAGSASSFSARLKLRDTRGRRLYLNARVTIKKTDGIKVSISAPYWLVNRTGLPLVFRAEGGAAEAAGQFAEHEVARMVAPLLFSFAEADGGPTLAARLGLGIAHDPEWCSPFGLGPGVGVKRLEARGEPERVYAVGVCARAGRGRYRHTNIVTLAPRYQLHNNTKHHLQFAQKCTATTLNDPGAIATHVSAVSGCYLPWHWARWEREHLLCLRILQPPAPAPAPAPPASSPDSGQAKPADGLARPAARTAWSGGFRIDTARTLHVACREVGGSAYEFVRVEVVLQGCTLFVVLSDAECAPPPLRIHNYSPVAIMFHQSGCAEECVVGAHAAAVWALPEPEAPAVLALRAPGGPRTALPLDALPATHTLLYQNFIYVLFTSTQKGEGMAGAAGGGGEEEGGLVLEVPLNSTRVVLGRKRYGDRAQLWRRGPNDQLIHEGSSPPQPTDATLADDAALTPHSMVLDIEDAAPRPGRASALVLRRADGRRASTQAWRLLAGRMACAHSNLCVQPDGGLMALTPGSRVVLGLPESRGEAAAGEVPAEQAVSWQTLRPGSGRLDVALTADGPTRLVTIHDHKEPESGWIEGEEKQEAETRAGGVEEWGVRVAWSGVSVSLVASGAGGGELVHARLAQLQLELAAAPRAARLALAVHHMQWDNQLVGTPSPVLLYCLPERGAALPALHAAAELMRARNSRYNAYFFRHLIVALRPLAVRLEERLILKLWAWAAPGSALEAAGGGGAAEAADEAEYEARRVLDELTALHATRLYFALIKIIPSQIRLSMCTANKLEGSLAALRRRLGLTLIRFEDACVELEPFVRAHPFDTPHALARQMLKHFKDELKWQAAKILGSVDFLGNPLGFVADVSEGVSGFFLEGNVSALLKNVTHGISNSAAKVSESLGDGLERVVGDEAHEETRRRIRSAAPGAHLAAGFRGLGLGILGGMTSLVKHSYEGATQEGLPGFLAGVGKGLVGTVTKPVIGVLDLAAETASALRDTSRRSDKWVPERVRPPRCAVGAGGLLPRYDAAQAAGAALLHALRGAGGGAGGGEGGAGGDERGAERLLAYRAVRHAPHDIRALLSTTYLRIVTCKHAQPQIVMETHLSNLVSCAAVSSDGAHYVELVVRGGGAGGAGGGEAVRRPRVQCDSAELAAWVAKHAAYARQLYHEQVHTLLPHTDL